MNWIERLVFWVLILAIGIAFFTVIGCQLPLRTGDIQKIALANL
jgi:hypothetical protein